MRDPWAALDEPAIKRALDLAVEASKLPSCVFPGDEGPPWNEGADRIVLLSRIGGLLSTMAMVHQADGNTDAALQCHLATIRTFPLGGATSAGPRWSSGSHLLPSNPSESVERESPTHTEYTSVLPEATRRA